MKRRRGESRIDECPHCGSDEIGRIRHTMTYTVSTKQKRRVKTNQDRLYFCHSCSTLIDVRLRRTTKKETNS